MYSDYLKSFKKLAAAKFSILQHKIENSKEKNTPVESVIFTAYFIYVANHL